MTIKNTSNILLENYHVLLIQGEDQQKLDVYTNDVFKNALINREIVCGIAIEEEDEYVTIEGKAGCNTNKHVLFKKKDIYFIESMSFFLFLFFRIQSCNNSVFR